MSNQLIKLYENRATLGLIQENFDILYVQYSIDSGSKWYKLGSKSPTWYNSDRNAIVSQNDCYNCIGAQWTGTNTMMMEYVNPLGEFVSFNNVQFRIVFHSDDATNAKGVVIDDFVIESTSILSKEKFELNKVAIYPNPSTDVFKVSLGNIIPKSIEIFDVSGKIIYSQKEFQNIGNIIPLNMTNASNGIYFVKISTEDQTITKTIIKK